MNSGNTGRQLAAFLRLQLVNLYGWNVYRNLKDPKEKRKKFWLGVAYAFVLVVLMCYVGTMSFGYVTIGLAGLLPAYLILLASLVILLFSVFKAGDILFQKNSYDILASLPVKKSILVVSRFVRLYAENVLLAVVVMLPAMVVFGVFAKPSWSFYVIGIVVTVFLPLIPITISVFVGAMIAAISSRAKYKNLVSAVLSVALVIGVMVGGIQMSMSTEEINLEELKHILNVALDLINRIYPPAIWLGNAMLTGNFAVCFGCVCGGLLVLGIVIGLVSRNYTWICDGIFRTSAKHAYQMEKLERNHLSGALFRREWKRYVSSSVYVTNTIVSPIMGMLFAISMLFVTPGQLEAAAAEIYAQTGLMLQMRNMLPMALAAVFCILPITAVSISMEGRQWWIIKTLPIRTKDLLDSKLLMNLCVIGPFYLLSVILVSIGQKVSFMEFIWILLLPMTAILFTCVFGQTVNLKLAVFDWENEAAIVKQSASSFVGGMVPFFVMIAATFGVMMIPAQAANIAMLTLCLAFGIAAFLLHRRNCKVNLLDIG